MDRDSEQEDDEELAGTSIVAKIAIVLISSIAFTLGVGSLLILLGTTLEIPDSVQVFNLINVFAPLLFSLLVALIYWQLYDVQKFETRILSDQKNIQDRQQRIEAQQLRPYVVVEDTHEIPDEAKIFVTASNFGHAPATNISLAVRAKIGDDVVTIGARRFRRKEDGYNGFSGLGDFLRPDDEYIQFHVKYPDLSWHSIDAENQNSVIIEAGLEYTDITNEGYFYQLQRSEVSPNDRPRYEHISWDAIRHSNPA